MQEQHKRQPEPWMPHHFSKLPSRTMDSKGVVTHNLMVPQDTQESPKNRVKLFGQSVAFMPISSELTQKKITQKLQTSSVQYSKLMTPKMLMQENSNPFLKAIQTDKTTKASQNSGQPMKRPFNYDKFIMRSLGCTNKAHALYRRGKIEDITKWCKWFADFIKELGNGNNEAWENRLSQVEERLQELEDKE